MEEREVGSPAQGRKKTAIESRVRDGRGSSERWARVRDGRL